MLRRPPLHAACSITCYKKAPVPPLLLLPRFKEQKEMSLLLCRRRKGGSRDRESGHELFRVAVGAGVVPRPTSAVIPVTARSPRFVTVRLGVEAGGCPERWGWGQYPVPLPRAWLHWWSGAKGGFYPCTPIPGAKLGLPTIFGCYGPRKEEKCLRAGTYVLEWQGARAPAATARGLPLQPAP